MSTATATHTRSPERESFLADIIVTAVEGGINYWASVTDYRWYDPSLDGGNAEPAPNGGGNAVVTVYDMEDDEDEGVTVDLNSMAHAVNQISTRDDIKYLSSGVRKIVQSASRQNSIAPDEGYDIDAHVADQVLQVAAYGEVVFG